MTRREKSAKIAADLAAAEARCKELARENERLRTDIADTARQIPMRGPLAIRVRALREKHAKEIEAAEARCAALEGQVRERDKQIEEMARIYHDLADVVTAPGEPPVPTSPMPPSVTYWPYPWPPNDLRTAFLMGAKWWEYESQGGTMWQSDQNKVAAEAEHRYPNGYASKPGEPPAKEEKNG